MSKKMISRLVPSLAFVTVILLLFTRNVRADCPPGQTLQCSGNPITCQCGGGDNGTSVPGDTAVPGGTSVPGETPIPGGTPVPCTVPGTVHRNIVDPSSRLGRGPLTSIGGTITWPQLPVGQEYCRTYDALYDACGNFIRRYPDWNGVAVCPPTGPTPPPPPITPCKVLYFDPNSGTVTCDWKFQWYLEASVSMPPIVIDARPYPVTLVKWPTAMRVNGLAEASGSGSLAYAGWGGGNPSSPAVRDWRNITLTLTFRPTGSPVSVTLMKQDTLTVPSSGGPPKIFTWQVPSHPAAGARWTAGEVGQLGEIPSDITLFEGHSQTTYRLFYHLSYEEYSTYFQCDDSATPTPNWLRTPGPSCVHGHTAGRWDGKSNDGEILPNQVTDLPPAMNGGSVYNDYSVVIQRMDENGSTSNPQYAHQYSWGSIFYWAVREGQGQISWP